MTSRQPTPRCTETVTSDSNNKRSLAYHRSHHEVYTQINQQNVSNLWFNWEMFFLSIHWLLDIHTVYNHSGAVGKCVKEVFFLRVIKTNIPQVVVTFEKYSLSRKNQILHKWNWPPACGGKEWNKALFWLQKCDDKLDLCKFCLQSRLFPTPPPPISFYSLQLTSSSVPPLFIS